MKKNPEKMIKLATPMGVTMLDFHAISENVEHVAASALRGERVELSIVKKACKDLEKSAKKQREEEREQMEDIVESLEKIIDKHDDNDAPKAKLNPARAFSLKAQVKSGRRSKAKRAAGSHGRHSKVASDIAAKSRRRRLAAINPATDVDTLPHLGTLAMYPRAVNMWESVYNDARDRGYSQGRSAKQAWSAVKKAGYHEDSKGVWRMKRRKFNPEFVDLSPDPRMTLLAKKYMQAMDACEKRNTLECEDRMNIAQDVLYAYGESIGKSEEEIDDYLDRLVIPPDPLDINPRKKNPRKKNPLKKVPKTASMHRARSIISANIATEMEAGKPQKRAVAIALSSARKDAPKLITQMYGRRNNPEEFKVLAANPRSRKQMVGMKYSIFRGDGKLQGKDVIVTGGALYKEGAEAGEGSLQIQPIHRTRSGWSAAGRQKVLHYKLPSTSIRTMVTGMKRKLRNLGFEGEIRTIGQQNPCVGVHVHSKEDLEKVIKMILKEDKEQRKDNPRKKKATKKAVKKVEKKLKKAERTTKRTAKKVAKDTKKVAKKVARKTKKVAKKTAKSTKAAVREFKKTWKKNPASPGVTIWVPSWGDKSRRSYPKIVDRQVFYDAGYIGGQYKQTKIPASIRKVRGADAVKVHVPWRDMYSTHQTYDADELVGILARRLSRAMLPPGGIKRSLQSEGPLSGFVLVEDPSGKQAIRLVDGGKDRSPRSDDLTRIDKWLKGDLEADRLFVEGKKYRYGAKKNPMTVGRKKGRFTRLFTPSSEDIALLAKHGMLDKVEGVEHNKLDRLVKQLRKAEGSGITYTLDDNLEKLSEAYRKKLIAYERLYAAEYPDAGEISAAKRKLDAAEDKLNRYMEARVQDPIPFEILKQHAAPKKSKKKRAKKNPRLPRKAEDKLWDKLGDWAFDEDRHGEIEASSDMTPKRAKALLDDAEKVVSGLRGRAAWESASAYFQEENLHGLTGPAWKRAQEVCAKPKKKATKKKVSKKKATKKATKKTTSKTKPGWKILTDRCEKLWEVYCKKQTKKALNDVFNHLAKMKASTKYETSKRVRDERARCLRAANKEAKRIGLKV